MLPPRTQIRHLQIQALPPLRPRKATDPNTTPTLNPSIPTHSPEIIILGPIPIHRVRATTTRIRMRRNRENILSSGSWRHLRLRRTHQLTVWLLRSFHRGCPSSSRRSRRRLSRHSLLQSCRHRCNRSRSQLAAQPPKPNRGAPQAGSSPLPAPSPTHRRRWLRCLSPRSPPSPSPHPPPSPRPLPVRLRQSVTPAALRQWCSRRLPLLLSLLPSLLLLPLPS